jgi:WD40 repeat protein
VLQDNTLPYQVAQMTISLEGLSTVAFSPNGKYVVSGSYDKTVRVWDVATGNEVTRMTHDGPVGSAAFSPDGKYVVSSSRDKIIRVWDIATGAWLRTMR